ncbi:MAG: putative dsRNA-binding protein [Gloeomargarita sp. SKYG116]|nr:putative dsRNA-binding protein [Gloeomargarita sp. SKYG116]MCS7226514.1 putative dsRNA-binding protein [Gloeomargarita sp. SKYB31]MDW8400395.1 ribonuclease III domain-containing protein [Gloeomargarita sp. SKYGB_i_bin116]
MVLVGSQRQQQLHKLLQRLGVDPQGVDWVLLDQALTHPSFDPQRHYEALEFVGDGVLRLLAADFLWQHYPGQSVGEYTALRSVLVSNRLLRHIAQGYGLAELVLVGQRLGTPGLWLADVLEAVTGAIYLSKRELTALQPGFYPYWRQEAERVRRDPARLNYKNALQEWTQAHYRSLPIYQTEALVGTPERFMARVYVQDQLVGVGQGESVKAAQQAAAREAWGALTGQAAGTLFTD